MKAAINDVDEVREVKFGEEIYFDLEGFLFAGPGQIDLEGVEVVVLAAEVDAEWSKAYLACPPSPRRR